MAFIVVAASPKTLAIFIVLSVSDLALLLNDKQRMRNNEK
jgi:hypothetical protein